MPGKSHGQRSLVGCSPWGRKELDKTEGLHFHFSLSCIGEGNGNPLQCSCLENPRDRGAWWVAVYGVAQSRTRLKRLSSSSSIYIHICICIYISVRLQHSPAVFCKLGFENCCFKLIALLWCPGGGLWFLLLIFCGGVKYGYASKQEETMGLSLGIGQELQAQE